MEIDDIPALAPPHDRLLARAIGVFLLAGILTFGLAVGTSIWNERQADPEQVVLGY